MSRKIVVECRREPVDLANYQWLRFGSQRLRTENLGFLCLHLFLSGEVISKNLDYNNSALLLVIGVVSNLHQRQAGGGAALSSVIEYGTMLG
mmetsp:Transcript_9218/g.15814  ORF Transcript_9218/g.15814 Transcript_9218/m.15814 type:complete len:92 (+) Transcript_9218:213-488(+)